MQNLKSTLLALVISVVLTAPAAAGPFEDGVTAYDQGDYATALRLLRPLAERGSGEAQYELGRMYAYGDRVPKDPAAATVWFRSAFRLLHPLAEQGDAKGQYLLGEMYSQGLGVPQDLTAAANWLRKATEQGNLGAQYSLGQMYDSRPSVKVKVLAHK